MKHLKCLGALTFAWAFAAAPAVADNNNPSGASNACAAKVQGLYGFQCHGSVSVGGALEPVTFIGAVEGNKGVYDGNGTLSSSFGSLPAHIAGSATFGPNCFGDVTYTTYDVTFPGSTTPVSFAPASFDFIGVDGGQEILGTAVAPSGVTGNAVPRLTCRLVRVH